jgi:hypothetical protein
MKSKKVSHDRVIHRKHAQVLTKDVAAMHLRSALLFEFVGLPFGGIFRIIAVDGRLQL